MQGMEDPDKEIRLARCLVVKEQLITPPSTTGLGTPCMQLAIIGPLRVKLQDAVAYTVLYVFVIRGNEHFSI